MVFQLQPHELREVANAAGAPVKFVMRGAAHAADGKLQFLVQVEAHVMYMPPLFDGLVRSIGSWQSP